MKNFSRISACAIAMLVSFLIPQLASAQAVASAPGLLGPPASPAVESEAVSQIPLSNSPSVSLNPIPRYNESAALSYRQQQARFEHEQRTMRIEWNKWIGYSPARPTLNASNMAFGSQLFYIPARAAIVSAGNTRRWYW
ncbi:hypothetical protein [Aureliella helgolandensis]|uniref:Uncharacterized protein n=1 Tax=Aureliella helgolandensis TaxID=2527968 RepID=A0A518G5Z3_9BACT|nr:hypothetical protein [Aureliella helgolandensis]QDV24011.1 hypothetical protein Q31a_23240 [Aureliella helgolandensis]